MTDSVLLEAQGLVHGDLGSNYECRSCGVSLPTAFYPYLRTQCKACQHEYQKEYRRRSAHLTVTKDKKYALKKRYGISPEQFVAKAEAQNWCCAICGVDPRQVSAWPPHHRVLHVDHSHASGKVRGLLCNYCNRGIGFFRDNAGLARKVSLYIEAHE